MSLAFLLRAWRRFGDATGAARWSRHARPDGRGGIYDHLGGGFHRYSTDERGWCRTSRRCSTTTPSWPGPTRGVPRRRRTYPTSRDGRSPTAREMTSPEGAFYSAQDADSEGEEGRFYVWDHDEFTSVLDAAGLDDAEAAVLADYWGVTAAGNWEGRSILHLAGAAAPPADLLERARRALLAARESRVRPGRDDKQLAAWNGMALRALSVGALVLADEGFATAARGVRRVRPPPAAARRRAAVAHRP